MEFQKSAYIGLTFSNYNYAFSNFYEQYKDLCLQLSERVLLHQIGEIRSLISTFVYEYDYTIQDKALQNLYRNKLAEINLLLQNDEEAHFIMNKDKQVLQNRLNYHKTYYRYFILYLELLARFIFELTSTFIPNTNIQNKLLKFANNQPFFEKFSQHKQIIVKALGEFKISEFNQSFNKLLIFYHAYSLYINEDDRKKLESLFSLILSIYLNEDLFRILNAETLSNLQAQYLKKISHWIHTGMLVCNAKMNESFSTYDVLPRVQKKINIDKTLI